MVTDKLFLLSEEEVLRYLSNEDRICMYKGNPCWWWLRSPGVGTKNAQIMGRDGSFYREGSVDYYRAIRPALHLNTAYLHSLKRTDDGYVRFGNIEWLFTEETGLMLSKDAVCIHLFDSESNNYEQSEIRDYMNNELLNELFTKEEKEMIADTVIDNETNTVKSKSSDTLYYYINNNGTMEISQNEPDGPATVHTFHGAGDFAETKDDIIIPATEMVMLISLYQHIKSKDIYNSYINPDGKNHE